MISAQTLRVCREGKPVSTFPDHALAARRFLGETIDACGLGKTCDGKFAEIGPVAWAGAGKRLRGHHCARQPAGNLFQPRGEIDRRSDAGEVETAGAADIAEQDAPDMQRHAEAKAFAPLAARILHGIDIVSGWTRGLDNAAGI